MRFYTQQHQYYCGIDLHARTMYNCILDQAGDTVLHKNIKTNPNLFLKTIEPYRDNLVVAAKCIFTWYQASLKLRPDRLACGSVCPRKNPLCPGTRTLHESHPRC